MSDQYGFVLEAGGLHYYPPPKKNKKDSAEEEQSPVRLSDHLDVIAMATDDDRKWGKLLRFADAKRREVRWVMPARLLEKREELWQELVSRGLQIEASSNAHVLLHKFLNDARPPEYVRVVSKLGWHNEDGVMIYVMPDTVYGDAKGITYIFESDRGNPYPVSGTLDQWREHIGMMCIGNSRMVLCVCVAFASACLSLINESGGMVHLVGDSQCGKSTAEGAGASTAMGKMLVWRMTDNGLEAICEERNDGVLALDEMGQANPHEIDKTAYMIANDVGKGRMSRDIKLREMKQWRVLGLSSGELTLADMMNEVGKKTRVGQEIRIINVPADAGAGMGVFGNIHGAASPGAFADRIRNAIGQYHGTAFRAFVARLASDEKERGAAIDTLYALRNAFINEHMPAKASGQVRSVCGKFGVIAAAGEIASQYGIAGWRVGEATDAAVKCFRAWLDKRGTIGDADLETGITQVIAFLEQEGGTRFEELTKSGKPIIGGAVYHQAGYRQPVEGQDQEGRYGYFVTPNAWKDVLCKGYNATAIAKELHARGLLIRHASQGNQYPYIKNKRRVYYLPARILDQYLDTRTKQQKTSDLIDTLMQVPRDDHCGGADDHTPDRYDGIPKNGFDPDSTAYTEAAISNAAALAEYLKKRAY